MNSQQQLQKAIFFIQADNTERGGLLLINYLRHHPQSEQGWLWMTNVVADIDLRLDCLEKALRINPHNKHALAMRVKLQQHRVQQWQSDQSQAPSHPEGQSTAYNTDVATVLADSYKTITLPPPLPQPHSEMEISTEPSTKPSIETPSETMILAKPAPATEANRIRLVTQEPSAQNFRLGLLGGLLGMLLGAGIWGTLGLLTGLQLGYIVLIVGLITGIAVRLMGQGQHSRFGLVGAGLTILGCVIGAYVYLVPTSGTLLPTIILPRLGAMFNTSTVILWIVTILLGYWLSFYHHSDKNPLFSAFATNR